MRPDRSWHGPVHPLAPFALSDRGPCRSCRSVPSRPGRSPSARGRLSEGQIAPSRRTSPVTAPRRSRAADDGGGTVAEELKKGTRVTGADRDKLAADLKSRYTQGQSIRA